MPALPRVRGIGRRPQAYPQPIRMPNVGVGVGLGLGLGLVRVFGWTCVTRAVKCSFCFVSKCLETKTKTPRTIFETRDNIGWVW